jgi:hypothetical protein
MLFSLAIAFGVDPKVAALKPTPASRRNERRLIPVFPPGITYFLSGLLSYTFELPLRG